MTISLSLGKDMKTLMTKARPPSRNHRLGGFSASKGASPVRLWVITVPFNQMTCSSHTLVPGKYQENL